VSAIRNVGELASPYYLREVWARRGEIDIDPETFATLKRKVRSLVRDLRAMESRGDDPDADWLARRRDLLGLDPLTPMSVSLADGSPFPLALWRDGGVDAVLVGDLLDLADPDARQRDEPDPPSTRFELALDAYDGAADWGLLLTGAEVRVYRRSSGISQQYLACDLGLVAEEDDDTMWKAFAAIFRAPGYLPGPDRIPLIQRIVDESRLHATRLAADMRDDVVDAAEALIAAMLHGSGNAAVLGPPTRALLGELFEEALYLLYRVLFVLYAEARDVLPISGAGPYRTTYSVDHLVELARRQPELAPGTYFDATLRRLFALLWAGPPDVTSVLGFDPVGGELFDPQHTPRYEQLTIQDAAWRRALTSIALGRPGSPRRDLGQRASFAELGVDQLGSIYEGLLVLEPYLATGQRQLVLIDGERRVIDADVDPASVKGRFMRTLDDGDFVLESASGRRKGSGSFYTPHEITEYLTTTAIEPLVEPILATAADDPRAASARILDLRVCDPAMGSGAFLVQAARILGLALARARAAGGDGRVTPEQVRLAERDVVRRCLYGVDLNPLAVALAKVSLWLETLQRGRPLSFLDAHLRCGDSLVGLDVIGPGGVVDASELRTWPAAAADGLKRYLAKELDPTGAAPLLAKLQGRTRAGRGRQTAVTTLTMVAITEALDDIAAKRDAIACAGEECDTYQHDLDSALAFAALESDEASLRNRLRVAADLWCAQWFSDGEDGPPDGDGSAVTPLSPAEYDQLVTSTLVGRPVPSQLCVAAEAARAVATRRFFHWALEFPEVIVERGGFDAVIGNPPWNTLSPDVKEFFSTYDPQVFRKGVPKEVQTRRKQELRQLDGEIDAAWRRESRFLYELSEYAKPSSGRFFWYAEDGQLRKGDANVLRLFVERAYQLLRPGGHLAQVVQDSMYIGSPSTGVRRHLLTDGRLERCYVFENRRKMFPIDSRIKIVLLTAQRGGGPTDDFAAAFFVGKDAAGRDRSISLAELPAVLADLDREAPRLRVADVELLAPATWSFPELQTALDAEIAAHCARAVPPLNLNDRGWGLTYCAELHADRDAWRFTPEEKLPDGSVRDGLRWRSPDGTEWWPLVEGTHFYHLEFPQEGKAPSLWLDSDLLREIDSRRIEDSTMVFDHYRVAWRDVARSTDERSAIAAVLPPRTAAKDKAPTVAGGLFPDLHVIELAAILSSFVFDYLVRFKGATSIKYGIINSVPTPPKGSIVAVSEPIAEVVCRSSEFDALWCSVQPGRDRRHLDAWEIAERRAVIDAEVAAAYGLSLVQYTAVLSSFPNVDRTQPMLPGEPKSFVTRDHALLAYARRLGEADADVTALLDGAGVDLPPPRPELRTLAARVARATELGAVPYRPSPKGGRTPTDPELIVAVRSTLTDDGVTAAEVAEALEEDPAVVKKVLEALVRDDEAFASGRGKGRRFYVVGDY
jgi:hypothetical protein